MKKRIISVIACILSIALIIGITNYLGYMFMPLRRDYGATWNMYLEEKEDSIDLMFVGSSMVYCDVIPAKIYEETGHTTYVMSAPYMMPDTAYYYIKEALKTQSPDVIMLEATSFFFSIKEADYYKVNLGYMPYGINRYEAILKTAPQSEKLGLLFPLYNYHDRWDEYSFTDIFSERADCVPDIMAGYTYLDKTERQDRRYIRDFLVDDEEYENNIKYMKKIIGLCREEGIELEMFIVPACEYVSQELTQKLQKEAGDIKVTNFNDHFKEIGLDRKKDFFDKRHVNFTGAVKFSDYLSEYIEENYDLPNSEHDTELWQERVEKIYTLQNTEKQ